MRVRHQGRKEERESNRGEKERLRESDTEGERKNEIGTLREKGRMRE